jgi:hypothetical protein
LLRLKSVIHNTLESFCVDSGVRCSDNASRNGLKTASNPVTRHSSHYLLLVLSAIIFALCAMPLSVANAKTVTLGWDSNDEPDLEGYVIYRNTDSPGPPYSYSDDVSEDELADPLHPQAKLTGLQEGNEYYIALTAYNTEGVESNYSDDICVEVVNDAVELCGESVSPPAATSSSSGGSGGGSSGCFISAASNNPSDNNLFLYMLLIIAAIGIVACCRRKPILNSAID